MLYKTECYPLCRGKGCFACQRTACSSAHGLEEGFEGRDEETSSVEFYEVLVLQGVQRFGDVEAIVVELFGQPGHLDADVLGAGHAEAAFGNKPGDVPFKRAGRGVEELRVCFLAMRGDGVEQVEPEDDAGLHEFQYLVFLQCDEVAGLFGNEGVEVALREPEEVVGFEDEGGRKFFRDGIAVIIGRDAGGDEVSLRLSGR